MIVDLLRNDLSRVCRDHTVLTPEICVLESFATVHHLVSTVTGELRPGLDAVDLLRATFPGGSITGAPKIRAMEIIAELEPTARGPYCGAIGWLGGDGWMDTSITIRTYAIKDGRVAFQAGGGIVADSDPAAEYEETLDKARALIEALRGRPMILLIDNYDSFVWNLARYVSELGHTRIVVRNDATSLDEIAALAPTHIIVSPGPCSPAEAGISNAVIAAFGPTRADPGGVPRPPVHRRGARRQGRARPAADARQDLADPPRWHGRVRGPAGALAGDPLPLADRRGRGPAGRPARHRPQRGGRDHGARAHRTADWSGVQFHPEAVLTEHGHELLREFPGAAGRYAR